LFFVSVTAFTLAMAVKDLIESGEHPDMQWFAKRFISIGMYALVDF
jgi:hypothetical protein